MFASTHAFSGFSINDIDAAVAQLHAAGVETKIYDDHVFPTDDKGIARGKQVGRGLDIAWLPDSSGNVLSVLSVLGALRMRTSSTTGIVET